MGSIALLELMDGVALLLWGFLAPLVASSAVTFG
jgi:hypothetical protein